METPAIKPQEARAYQARTLARVRTLAAAGKKRLLIVLPTGGGKTTVAAHAIKGAVEKGMQVSFIAHRKELIDQCSQRLDGEGVPHGIIMADHPRWRPWEPVQVCSIQTISSLRQRGRPVPPAGLVFVDEAHRARADSYTNALEQHWPDAFVLGLTATPWRTDNKGLGDLFDDIIVGATVRELTTLGFLVPVGGFAYDVPDLTAVKQVGADYDEGQLAEVMSKGAILGSIVDHWRERAFGVRTVVFACTVKHSILLRDQFLASGVRAEHVDGNTPKREREGILARLASGETTVVCNVGILTEGWDCPPVEVIVLARPTKSIALYLQMVGRGLRPVCRTCGKATRWILPACEHCGSHDIKRIARIHDHSGCSLVFGLPDQPREYTLATSRRRDRFDSPSPVRQCSECYALYAPRLLKCPSCGHENPKVQRIVEEVEGDIIDFDDMGRRFRTVANFAERLEEFNRLSILARSRGLPASWAAQQYEKVFKQKCPFRPQFPNYRSSP